MAKAKTKWVWRGREFGSKKELIDHLRGRAREAVDNVLGPPVDEVTGRDVQTHLVRFKVRISLAVWRPKKKRPAAAPSSGKRAKSHVKALPKQSIAEVDTLVQEYFG